GWTFPWTGRERAVLTVPGRATTIARALRRCSSIARLRPNWFSATFDAPYPNCLRASEPPVVRVACLGVEAVAVAIKAAHRIDVGDVMLAQPPRHHAPRTFGAEAHEARAVRSRLAEVDLDDAQPLQLTLHR